MTYPIRMEGHLTPITMKDHSTTTENHSITRRGYLSTRESYAIKVEGHSIARESYAIKTEGRSIARERYPITREAHHRYMAFGYFNAGGPRAFVILSVLSR